jgi:hypothetical protein
MSKDIPDEWLNLASSLLSYLHSSLEIREAIIEEAFCQLPLISRKQTKRVYARIKEPKRIYLEDHLPRLQLSLLERSRYKEKEQEGAAPNSLSPDDWSIRLMAFATEESLKNNSQYAAIIWCCFIHDYLLREALNFYDSLRDVSEPHVSDELFRQKKGKEIREFKKRFPNLEENIPAGKDQYFIRRANQSAQPFRRLVEDFRNILKPWSTECSEERRRTFPLHKLFRKHVAYGDRELKRVHKFICPDCFRALTEGTADSRLGLPKLP